jgi:pimeloyl-ACP methyl ester carboxylesterase
MAAHVVFVHGMWSTPLVWNAWRAHFEHAGFTTEALTLPGHGVDEPDHALHGVGLADCVASVEQYIAQMEEPPVLIGHSLGGLITQQVAARRPLAAAVLVCSAAPAPIFPQRPAMLPHLIRHFLPWQSWRKSFRLSRHEAGYLLFNAMDRDSGDALFDDMKAESGRIAWETAYGLLNWTGSNRVNRSAITCPLLALAGMQDHIIPLGVSRRMARWYGKQLDYREYPQHAHWMLDAEAGWEDRAEEACQWIRLHAGNARKNAV